MGLDKIEFGKKEEGQVKNANFEKMYLALQINNL